MDRELNIIVVPFCSGLLYKLFESQLKVKRSFFFSSLVIISHPGISISKTNLSK